MFGKTPFTHDESYMLTLYDNFAHNLFHGSGKALPDFRTDIWDGGDAYILEAELPGFQKEDIQLELNGQLLTITASRKGGSDANKSYILQERKSASFKRTFDISGVDGDVVTAAYENGLLRVKLPKVHPAAGTGKQIQIL